jgi:hypothetical protein
MNVIDRNPREFHNSELDVLLRNFFRAEMPDPWPTLKAPVEATLPPARPMPRRWTFIRSKLALAASVALLMAGSWYLSGSQTPDYSQPAGVSPLGNPGSARKPNIRDLFHKSLDGSSKKSSESNPTGASGCDCCK